MLKRFGLGFAVGYVFGARSGEKQYAQLVKLGKEASELPLVRDLLDRGDEAIRRSGRRIVSSIRTLAYQGSHDADYGDPADADDTDLEGERDRYDADETDADETDADETGETDAVATQEELEGETDLEETDLEETDLEETDVEETDVEAEDRRAPRRERNQKGGPLSRVAATAMSRGKVD